MWPNAGVAENRIVRIPLKGEEFQPIFLFVVYPRQKSAARETKSALGVICVWGSKVRTGYVCERELCFRSSEENLKSVIGNLIVWNCAFLLKLAFGSQLVN